MIQSRALIVLALAASLAACGQQTAKDADPEAAVAGPPPAPHPDWAPIEAEVGKLPYQSGLLDTSVIAPDLKALLGAEYAPFQANMQTVSPLLKASTGVLYVVGSRDNDPGVNSAYLMIEPSTKALEVGLWKNRAFSTYATPGSAIPKPRDIQTAISRGSG